LYACIRARRSPSAGTPALAAAARKSLEIRGDNATGWGLGWRLNLWARLHDGEHAYTILERLLSPERTYPNMFDAHPPFQIDGNFGGTAGIAEMLLQSHGGRSRAVAGAPEGVAERRGERIASARADSRSLLTWKDGALTAASVRALAGQTVRIALPRRYENGQPRRRGKRINGEARAPNVVARPAATRVESGAGPSRGRLTVRGVQVQYSAYCMDTSRFRVRPGEMVRLRRRATDDTRPSKTSGKPSTS
jgi:hypothetical protein